MNVALLIIIFKQRHNQRPETVEQMIKLKESKSLKRRTVRQISASITACNHDPRIRNTTMSHRTLCVSICLHFSVVVVVASNELPKDKIERTNARKKEKKTYHRTIVSPVKIYLAFDLLCICVLWLRMPHIIRLITDFHDARLY